MFKKHVYTIPQETYEVTAIFEGKTIKTIVKPGETVTPQYNPKTRKITLEKNRTKI